MKKFIRFIRFLFESKFPKLVKKMSDTELLELYYKFSPLYWNKTSSSLREELVGGIIVFSVGEEFKRRYPNKHRLQAWNYSREINLHDVIKGGKW